jgi:hypothetical protein
MPRELTPTQMRPAVRTTNFVPNPNPPDPQPDDVQDAYFEGEPCDDPTVYDQQSELSVEPEAPQNAPKRRGRPPKSVVVAPPAVTTAKPAKAPKASKVDPADYALLGQLYVEARQYNMSVEQYVESMREKVHAFESL